MPGTWRGSLQLRAVSLTLLLSIVIAFILGWVLNSKVRDGLVQAKESSSLAMVSSGFSEASASIAGASEGFRQAGAATGGVPLHDAGSGAWVNSLADMVRNLCTGANSDT